MDTRTVISVGLVVTLCSVTQVWSNLFDGTLNWPPSRRSSQCLRADAKCYTSNECCDGYVCAAVDDVFGLNPEVPGYCVKEKHLRPCTSNSHCTYGFKCMTLAVNEERYCVPKPPKDTSRGSKKPKPKAASRVIYADRKNSLGGVCVDDSDCKPYTNDGKDALCCQIVRRYRQKPKQMCDRVTPISDCIKKK